MPKFGISSDLFPLPLIFLVPVQTECEFERKNSSRRQITYRHLETIEQEPKDFINV